MKLISTLVGLILLLCGSTVIAQPDFIGTMLPNGLYQTYNLNDLGAFRQVQMQATSSAVANTRIWEFATGTYFENWRPYTFPTTLSGFNQVINPGTAAASARYNNGFGGASSWLPPITSGNYYVFNVTEFAPPADQFMSLLETTYSPVSFATATTSRSSVCPATAVNVSVTLPQALSTGENLYIRYSTDGFTSSSVVNITGAGTSFSGMIPAQSTGTTVAYYVFSSPVNSTDLATEVGANGEVAYDMMTFNLLNNATANYSYTVAAGITPDAGTPATICGNVDLNLADLNASVSAGYVNANTSWNTSGTGTFNGDGTFDNTTIYMPSAADRTAGTVTLTLEYDDGTCMDSDDVIIPIANIDCGTYPWTGN